MTHVLIKGVLLGGLAGGLAACATTPAYPIGAPQASPPPAAAPAAAPAAPTPEPAAPPPSSPLPAPASVSSQPLAPVQAPPETAPAEAPRPAPRPAAANPPPTRAETVRLVATGKVEPAKSMYRDYVIRRGDHLDAIARDLQTTRAILVEANHLKTPDTLKPGQHLRVPIEKAYVVVAGDTVEAVARRFEVSPEDLADLNVIPERQKLRAGEMLALPMVFHDRGPVPAAPARAAGRYTPLIPYKPIPSPPSSATAAPALTDSQVMAAGRGRFVWPVRGEILSSFGVQDVGRRNDGIDVKAQQGAVVHAAAEGDVVYAGDQVPGFGNLVLVKHSDGWVTAYAHLDRILVKMRDVVAQDQQIGLVGVSGGVAEAQLHFEIRYAPSPLEKAKPIDPLLVLPK